MERPEAWKEPRKLEETARKQARLSKELETVDGLGQGLEAARELFELAQEEQDEEAIQAVRADLSGLTKELRDLEWRRMFNRAQDPGNAYLDVQSGSGGTEAQDWAEMLLRMYLRWCEKCGLETRVTGLWPGETAGLRSATVHVCGDYAYGWLRTESGVHRLVRKSPFDSGRRRHTSFASIFVAPEVDDHIEIEINPSHLRVDTYRASGAGGQHVNKTDSAVRITHLPTNLVVQCQEDRSQHRNRAQAMRQLRSKLYELELRRRRAEHEALAQSKDNIGWGSQIRSYILDQSRIKDLRTGVETGNTQAVLDGELGAFVEASLKHGA